MPATSFSRCRGTASLPENLRSCAKAKAASSVLQSPFNPRLAILYLLYGLLIRWTIISLKIRSFNNFCKSYLATAKYLGWLEASPFRLREGLGWAGSLLPFAKLLIMPERIGSQFRNKSLNITSQPTPTPPASGRGTQEPSHNFSPPPFRPHLCRASHRHSRWFVQSGACGASGDEPVCAETPGA